jgi:hypothetical protein
MREKNFLVFGTVLLVVGIMAVIAHTKSIKSRDVSSPMTNGRDVEEATTTAAAPALEDPTRKELLKDFIQTRGITDEEGIREAFKEVYGIEFEPTPLGQKSGEGNPFILHGGGPDSFGYTFDHVPFNFLNLQDRTIDTSVIEVELGDDTSFVLSLPHQFCLYDQNIDTFSVSSNGYLTVLSQFGSAFFNTPIPDTIIPHNLIAVFWDDLWGIGGPPDREIRYKHLVGGTRTIDTTIIQYNNWGYFMDFGMAQNTFQVILESTGHITFNYLNVDSTITYGPHSATAGTENSTGTIGLEVAFNQFDGNGHIKDSTSIRITPPNPCLVGIEENSVVRDHFSVFRLKQNHPNPFHSSTTIIYTIPSSNPGSSILNHVSLIIYDITGRLVETLVNQPQEPGIHHVEWDSRTSVSVVRSGIYFYRLQAGRFISTKKMIILR